MLIKLYIINFVLIMKHGWLATGLCNIVDYTGTVYFYYHRRYTTHSLERDHPFSLKGAGLWFIFEGRNQHFVLH